MVRKRQLEEWHGRFLDTRPRQEVIAGQGAGSAQFKRLITDFPKTSASQSVVLTAESSPLASPSLHSSFSSCSRDSNSISRQIHAQRCRAQNPSTPASACFKDVICGRPPGLALRPLLPRWLGHIHSWAPFRMANILRRTVGARESLQRKGIFLGDEGRNREPGDRPCLHIIEVYRGVVDCFSGAVCAISTRKMIIRLHDVLQRLGGFGTIHSVCIWEFATFAEKTRTWVGFHIHRSAAREWLQPKCWWCGQCKWVLSPQRVVADIPIEIAILPVESD